MKEYSQCILAWYEENKRDLPWRRSSDPYKVWISEIMLQQTRVDQGLDYFKRFIKKFPNVNKLAEASEDEVLHLWQGLGYYSRARNLHYSAQIIAKLGAFPSDYKKIIELKGIGVYTAAAIASIAFNQPYAAIDGNVYRVVSRIFGISDAIDTTKGKLHFKKLCDKLLDREHPGEYNQAMMDFGALQCVPSSPNCEICPLNEKCYAYTNSCVDALPYKSKKMRKRDRYFHYFFIKINHKILIKKRNGKDIWKGLYEPLLIETNKGITFENLLKREPIESLIKENSIFKEICTNFKHILTHQNIYASLHTITIEKDIVLPFLLENYILVEEEELKKLAFPQLLIKIFEKFNLL